MDSRLWPCPPAATSPAFVQPPCVDGHTDDGGECPEWICADCGAALLIGDAGAGVRTVCGPRRRLAARYPGVRWRGRRSRP